MTRTSVGSLALLLAAGAASSCSESTLNPSAPLEASLPGSATAGSIGSERISGTVYQVTNSGAQPLAGAVVTAQVGGDSRQVVADAAGGYSVDVPASSPGSVLVWLFGRKSGFSSPCRPSLDSWRRSHRARVDLFLVANQILSTSGMPPYYPLTPPAISGTVRFNGIPIKGVPVLASISGQKSTVADTFSDSTGRYTLCGLNPPPNPDFAASFLWIGASRSPGPWFGGYVDLRSTAAFDIAVD